MSADSATLIKQAKAQGWQVRLAAGSGHFEMTSPAGRKLQIAATPSDHRSRLNDTVRMRRAGLRRPEAHQPDPAREERMARAAASGATNTEVVLSELQRTPGVGRRAAEIAQETGLNPASVPVVLGWLINHHPEVKRIERGVYRWQPAEAAPKEPSLFVQPTDDTDMTNEEFDKAMADGVPAKVWGTPPGHVNGNGTEAAVASLRQVADATIEVATPAEPSVIRVVPSALPSDLPAMFEAVTTDGAGHLILRDEHGGIWMAVPMKPVL